jgi:hypothetical protein
MSQTLVLDRESGQRWGAGLPATQTACASHEGFADVPVVLLWQHVRQMDCRVSRL